MSQMHHPSGETLLAHAAGSLDAAFRVVVATHLATCAACRETVLQAERVGGAVMAGLEDAPMAEGALARVMARLDEPETAVPAVVPEGLPVALAGYAVGKWRKVVPGIAIAPVSGTARGRAGLHLLRLEPGVRLAGHGHGGMEMTVVLDGAIEDAHGTYSAGDVAENAEDAHHAPVAVGERACVCLVALEGKLRFHHWLVRMLQPLFGV